jgi:hypothetical protein
MLVNTAVCSNHIGRKEFVMDLKENTIENVKNYFQQNYISKFKYALNPYALLALNKNKTEGITINTAYSYGETKIERYPEGRNVMLESGLFLNECLTFNVPGSTLRQVNRFIGLDRPTGNIDNDFDEKFLGQWFVTRVVHEFTQTGYTNTITAVKPYASRNLKIDDEVA